MVYFKLQQFRLFLFRRRRRRNLLKVAHYSFITARELVTNFAGNWLIVGKKYEVTCVKMPINEHIYLAIPSVSFF